MYENFDYGDEDYGGAIETHGDLAGFEMLEEEMDEDYEPTQEEIVEYAKYLGMDGAKDKTYFYIAKEGLKAPLPSNWKPCKSPRGSIYYFNINSSVRQKEHPCDDYYRDLFKKEKVLNARKKEEKVIKQKQKEMQKQQQMSEDINLQQMMMMNNSGIHDQSMSFMNEKVQIELEKIMDDYDDLKIDYQKKRLNELKELEIKLRDQETEDFKTKAQDAIDKQKRNIKSEVENEVQTKQSTLQREKNDAVASIVTGEKTRQREEESQVQKRLEKEKDLFKQDTENRLEKERDQIKEIYQRKQQAEIGKIEMENKKLLQDSDDIETQKMILRGDEENEFENNVADLKQSEEKQLEKYRELQENQKTQSLASYKKQLNIKLEAEKQKEEKKYSKENSKMNDKKAELKRTMNQKVRDTKRQLESESQNLLKQKTIDYENDEETQKQRLRGDQTHFIDIKDKKMLSDFEREISDIQAEIGKYKEEKEEQFQKDSDIFKKELDLQYQKVKSELERDTNDHVSSYNDILATIEKHKDKIKELTEKSKQLDKKVRDQEYSNEDTQLLFSAKQREKEEEKRRGKIVGEGEEKELEKKLESKRDEHEGLKANLLSHKGDKIGGYSGDYEKVRQELKNLKTLARGLKIQGKPQFDKHNQDDETLELTEIRAFIEVQLPTIRKERKKAEEDRVVLQTLTNNLNKNRSRWRSELYSSDVSTQKRLALEAIKDKVDGQAQSVQDESDKLKDKCLQLRRQEEKLVGMKAKSELLVKQYSKAVALDLNQDYKDYQIQFCSHVPQKPEKLDLTLKWQTYLDQSDGFEAKSFAIKDKYSDSQYKYRSAVYGMIDRQVTFDRNKRLEMCDFLGDQHRWLSRLKVEIGRHQIY